MSLFPIFLKLRQRRCLVVGAGAVAEGKIESLLKAEADVLVVAPEVNARIAQWHAEKRIQLEQREFHASDLDERELWPKYQEAFEEMIRRCSTEVAPWHVVPANHKWYRDLVVARAIIERLEGLKLGYPEPDPGIEGRKVK